MWSCWRLAGHWWWRCGSRVSPAFTSQLSAPPVAATRVQAPAQDRCQQRGATGGLLWAAPSQPEGTAGTQDNPWDICCSLLGHSGTSPFRTNCINQYRIFVLSWRGVNVVSQGTRSTREKQEKKAEKKRNKEAEKKEKLRQEEYVLAQRTCILDLFES